jgi:hypothetical protein
MSKKMKSMKHKIIFVLILFVVVFFSCKKDELTVTGNTEVMFLSEVLLDDQPYYQYEYNDSNLVSAESSKFDYTVNHYNDKNQLISSDYYWNNSILKSDAKMIETALSESEMINSSNGSKGGSIKYEYTGEQVTKATYSRPSGGSEYSTFSYDANNRVNKQDLFWNNNETGYIEYQYDSKGNLVKEMLYDISGGAPELTASTKYAFDNKQNPFHTSKSTGLPGINSNRNNIIKEVCTVYTGNKIGDGTVQTTVNTYEYNVNGYPVSKNGSMKYIYN